MNREWKLSEWPNALVPRVAAGGCTIWSGKAIIYAEMTGKAQNADGLLREPASHELDSLMGHGSLTGSLNRSTMETRSVFSRVDEHMKRRAAQLLMILSAAIFSGGCAGAEPASTGSGVTTAAAPLDPDGIVVEATMSHMGLQHPMSADPTLQNKAVSYVVVEGNEVTVYADTPVSCPNKVRLTGKWTSASGDKGGQHVVDRQLAATRWECIP